MHYLAQWSSWYPLNDDGPKSRAMVLNKTQRSASTSSDRSNVFWRSVYQVVGWFVWPPSQASTCPRRRSTAGLYVGLVNSHSLPRNSVPEARCLKITDRRRLWVMRKICLFFFVRLLFYLLSQGYPASVFVRFAIRISYNSRQNKMEMVRWPLEWKMRDQYVLIGENHCTLLMDTVITRSKD